MTQEEAIETFDSIFIHWPKQDGERKAKAMTVTLLMTKQLSPMDLKRSAENYLFFTDPMYCRQFSNWLEGDWKEWIRLNPKQEKVMSDAKMFILLWMDARKEWWPRVENLKRCQRLFSHACYDEYFYENWKRGINTVSSWKDKPIFASMTISWFCDRSKCTLEKILELSYEDNAKKTYKYARIKRDSVTDSEGCGKQKAFTLLQSIDTKERYGDPSDGKD